MKTSARAPVADPSSHRRQSTRSIRSTANRPANYYARPFGFGGSSSANISNAQPAETAPGFFPAITHFTDTLASLPKEVIRHITILKETEGKAHGPAETINQVLDAISSLPPPARQEPQTHTQFFGMNPSANVSVTGSITNGSTASFHGLTTASQPQATDEQADLPRRQLFHNLRLALQTMSSVLDEKNHYLNAANDALAKQLARLDSSFPHIKDEISEEAREGSDTHWALPHMRDARRLNAGPVVERVRRDVMASSGYGAGGFHDSAEGSRHRNRNAAFESDFEERVLTRKPNKTGDSNLEERGLAKKSHKKMSKPQEVGDKRALVNGGQASQPTKRRRPDKANGAVAMERSASTAGTQKKAGDIQRESSVAETSRKRPKALPGATNRKRILGNSPSLASSPIRSGFPHTQNQKEFSPAPSLAMAKPSSSRARPQSAHGASSENNRMRASSTAGETNQVSGASINGIASTPITQTAEPMEVDSFAPAEEGDTIDDDTVLQTAALQNDAMDIDPADQHDTPASSIPMTTTRSRGGSKASKPSTPLASEFPDAIPSTTSTSSGRPRNNRTASNPSGHRSSTSNATTNPSAADAGAPSHTAPAPRRSHKKGAGLAASLLAAQNAAQAHAASMASANTADEPGSERRPSQGSHRRGDRGAHAAGASKIQTPTPTPTGTATQALINHHANGAARDKHDADADADMDNEGRVDEEGEMDDEEDEEDEDGEGVDGGADALYCVCNGPSYGEMIACDNEACEREWFHLKCVGLERPPPSKVKWYCPGCRETFGGGIGAGSGGVVAGRGRTAVR